MRTLLSAIFALAVMLPVTAQAVSTAWLYGMKIGPDGDVWRFARTEGPAGAYLSITCTGGLIWVIARTHKFDQSSSAWRSVVWQTDRDKVHKAKWIQSGSGSGAMDAGLGAVELAEALLRAQSRFSIDTGGNKPTFEFGVRGSTATVGRVLRDCGY